MWYRVRWWLSGIVAHAVTFLLFTGFEVVGASVDHRGPRLIVANHLSGLLDAVVVTRTVGGLPNILARSTLFTNVFAKAALRSLGVIPLYRRSDHADTAKNESSFRDVTKALVKGRTVLIFPEGHQTDRQALQEIRTGAARMALEAIDAGASNLAIIPIGIAYEDKISARSRVLVVVGDKITADEIERLAHAGGLTDADHQLVRSLTGVVEERLTAVSPGFGSLVRERMMMLAASIHLHTSLQKPFTEPAMSELRGVAQRLADTVGSDDAVALDATGRYLFALTASGLHDEQVQPRPTVSQVAHVVFKKGLIVLVMAPLALLGLVWNLAAIVLVVLVGALVRSPASKGTVRAATAVVVFPLSWTLMYIVVRPPNVWLALFLIIVGLVFLVLGFAQLLDLFDAVADWWAVHNSAALLSDLRELRARSEAELVSLLSGSPDG
jgi:1-acyl-sn-glycerol-3-phosphate acyltransferase